MTPLVLELDEVLKEEEFMTGVKTIQVEYKEGYSKLGYVAIIRNHNNRDIRYGNLKATPYLKRKFGNTI